MENNSNPDSGFTLLEVLIAVLIMLVAFTSVFSIQSSSMTATGRAKQMADVLMLARQAMTDAELATEGKAFGEVKTEEGGNFDKPFADFKWKREIKEVKFPNLSMGTGGKEGEGDKGQEGGDAGGQIAGIISNYLSKAIREIRVTITWPVGRGTQTYSLTSYWVDLNHELQLTP